MCGAIYSQMVLQGEPPDPVTLVPLLVEGTERKMNDPAALCLMALGSQFVGGILIGHWHCLTNLQLGSNGGIFRRAVEKEHRETRLPLAHRGSSHPGTCSSKPRQIR